MTVRVPIFELMPPLMDADPDESSIPYHVWEAAVKAFVSGNWASARPRFERFVNALSERRAATEKAAHVFLGFMDRHQSKPPEGWDGTIEMDAK